MVLLLSRCIKHVDKPLHKKNCSMKILWKLIWCVISMKCSLPTGTPVLRARSSDWGWGTSAALLLRGRTGYQGGVPPPQVFSNLIYSWGSQGRGKNEKRTIFARQLHAWSHKKGRSRCSELQERRSSWMQSQQRLRARWNERQTDRTRSLLTGSLTCLT